jgi:hypothetical protein
MKTYYRIGFAMLPLVGAAVLASTTVYSVYLEDQQKRGEVNNTRNENDRLTAKLNERKAAERRRDLLESDISMLRGSVPKAPELDLFILDLEKMCTESGVDLISIETPDADALRALGTSEEEVKQIQEEGRPLSMGSKSLGRDGRKGSSAKPQDQTALKQLTKQVYVTSNYDGIIKLLKKLESYQRVTGVKEVCVAMASDGSQTDTTTAAERAKKFGLNQPVMSFLMTLYYLP